MKAFIMTDLEGVSGVNGRSDGIGNKIINNEASCRLLTEEVNAVVEGLVEAGAEEVLVVDGHGGSNSISPEHLHPKAMLQMAGGGVAPVTHIDASFAVALHLGTHAMIGVADGFLNHTFNSHAVANMWLNDAPVGEIAIEALVSAYYGVPTVLVSGDRAACREARAFLGRVETVEAKVSLSRYTVVNRSPARVRDELRETARNAILNRKSYPVKMIPPPVRHEDPVDVPEPGGQLRDARDEAPGPPDCADRERGFRGPVGAAERVGAGGSQGEIPGVSPVAF